MHKGAAILLQEICPQMANGHWSKRQGSAKQMDHEFDGFHTWIQMPSDITPVFAALKLWLHATASVHPFKLGSCWNGELLDYAIRPG